MEDIEDINYAKAFGKRIKQLRHAQNMSQTDLAGKANLEKTAIQRIERGCNSTLKTLRKLAVGLDIPMSELFDF